MKRQYNSHSVAEALIQHFGLVLQSVGGVLNKVENGERHAKKKIVSNIDVGRNYCYGHGFIGLRDRRTMRRHETF